MQKVVAIDGPSGSGKSVLAKALATRLGFQYIDTGAMFRACALVLMPMGFDFKKASLTEEESDKVLKRLHDLNFDYAPTPSILIRVNGQNLTQEIRQNHVSLAASHVSKFPVVRTFLADWQRELAQKQWVVMEGRDIGTKIFPDAFLKLFVTAKIEVRAARRLVELKEQGRASGLTLEKMIDQMTERDAQDENRPIAPLSKHPDAVEIDSSELSAEEVVQKAQKLFEQKQQSS